MRIITTAAVLGAASFGLAACGQADRKEVSVPGGEVTVEGSGGDRSVTVEGADGQRVAYASGAAAAPSGAPAFAQPYPGAEIEQSVQVPGREGGMLVFRTQAHPDTVIAYYQERAEEAGMASGAQMTQGETRMYGAEAGDGGELMVIVAPVEGQSTVTLTWSAAG